MNALVNVLAWIRRLFGEPNRPPRTAPPACPFCGGRRWVPACPGCDHGRFRCLVCAGTGVVPTAAIAGGPHPATLIAYARAFPWN